MFDMKFGLKSFLFSIFCAAGVYFYLLTKPDLFKSELLIISSSSESNSSSASKFSGLAALAGVNLSNGAGDKTLLAIEIIKSRKFLLELSEIKELNVHIMSELNIIKKDSLYLNNYTGEVYSVAKYQSEIYEHLNKMISVSQEKDSGAIRISYKSTSPSFSKDFLERLLILLNESMRKNDRNDVERNMSYLLERITETHNPDIKSSIALLIEEQQKKLMLINAKSEYALKTIDPAYEPYKKSEPQRFIITFSSAFLMFTLFVVLRVFIKMESRRELH